MNIIHLDGAVGLPRTSPFCGMPLKRVFASGAPGRATGQVALPVGQAVDVALETVRPLLPPLAEDDGQHDRDHHEQHDTTPIASARGDA